MDEKTPLILYIDKKDRELYDRLAQEVVFKSKGKEKDNRSLFIYAVIYGYKNKKNLELTELTSKETYLRVEYLKPEDWVLFQSIAIEQGSIEILGNFEKLCQLIEQYAHTGIKLLVNEIDSGGEPGTFEKKFEKELLEIYKNLPLNNEESTSS